MVSETELRETVAFQKGELESWRKRFIELNREFHKNQEDLMLMQAEFDAHRQRKQQQQVITSTSTVVRQSMRSQQPILLSDNLKQSCASIVSQLAEGKENFSHRGSVPASRNSLVLIDRNC